MALPRISVFPKCYVDEIIDGQRTYISWIHDAATLGGEGVEHYDEFFPSYDERDVAPVMAAMEETGQISSMMCFSPDFTHPDRDVRLLEVERQKLAIDLTIRTGARHCRTLSGQKYPGLSLREGVARAADCIKRALEYAAKRDVVLCLENHYKVGQWLYPEFAQQEEPFLALLDAVPESPYFGVQYRSFERPGWRLRSDSLPAKGQASRRHDARLGQISHAGDDARTDPDARRYGGLSRPVEAW